MNRDPKIAIHVYFPEASNSGKKINLCEDFYLQNSFKRKIKNAVLETYANSQKKEFTNAFKMKKRKKSPNKNDVFFIVLDTDIHANLDNVDDIRNQIQLFYSEYGDDVQIILSGRSFEVWLCMYYRPIYTAPFTTQDKLNKDILVNEENSYMKNEDWYKDHAELLYTEYENAKESNLRSKTQVFNSTMHHVGQELAHPFTFPNYGNIDHINFLILITPFSYFHVLIDCLKHFE